MRCRTWFHDSTLRGRAPGRRCRRGSHSFAFASSHNASISVSDASSSDRPCAASVRSMYAETAFELGVGAAQRLIGSAPTCRAILTSANSRSPVSSASSSGVAAFERASISSTSSSILRGLRGDRPVEADARCLALQLHRARQCRLSRLDARQQRLVRNFLGWPPRRRSARSSALIVIPCDCAPPASTSRRLSANTCGWRGSSCR